MKQLDPKSVWLFFLSYLTGILFMTLPFFFVLTFAFRFDGFVSEFEQQDMTLPSILLLITENWWFILILLILLGYAWAQLTYHFYKYELTEDGFRKEFGIIWKQYVTIPYERIQNVDIYRGVWARLLGLSDLQIQTAGMSAVVNNAAGAGSEGRLPGISREDAEKLRDILIKKARGSKGI